MDDFSGNLNYENIDDEYEEPINCTNCGKILDGDSFRCPYCGEEL